MSIKSDVDRGLEITLAMEALKSELKDIEARLHHAGLNGPQVELEDAEREGRQYLAKGSTAIVPVVFTADLIVKTFPEGGDVHRKILGTLRGDCEDLSHFYVPRTTFNAVFDSGKKLRSRAAEMLGEDAPPFVDACLARDKHGIPKSQIKVEWDRAETESEGA